MPQTGENKDTVISIIEALAILLALISLKKPKDNKKAKYPKKIRLAKILASLFIAWSRLVIIQATIKNSVNNIIAS